MATYILIAFVFLLEREEAPETLGKQAAAARLAATAGEL